MQSWLCGKLLQLFDSDAVALHTSRGYETEQSKAWMRQSVIAADILGDALSFLDVPDSSMLQEQSRQSKADKAILNHKSCVAVFLMCQVSLTQGRLIQLVCLSAALSLSVNVHTLRVFRSLSRAQT